MLTMVISLIPSTLVTTAFAADAAGNGVDITNAIELVDDTNAIANAGVYKISGTRQNPVKITATGEVVLVLNNVTINTLTSPIELSNGAKVTLVVLDGTNNTLTCTATAANDSNGGKTAGILVPDTATLTIDKQENGKGNGELTVKAGVGGAGIGGGAGTSYIEDQAASGNSGSAGSSGSGANTYGQNNPHYVAGGVGGAGGQGGQGGHTGGTGGALGTLTINAGVLNITGGTNAAGIGGGVGGTGENGQNGSPGANGNQGGKYAGESGTWLYMAAGGGGGNGGGGAGGNGGTGGRGGDGGRVNITGGSVTVTGGSGAPDIGGGNGGSNGQGGIGGASNTYYDFGAAGAAYDFDNPNQRAINYFSAGRLHVVRRVNAGGAGGRGADGYDGLEGSGGAGAIVNITGGIVSLTNKTISGGNTGKKITRHDRKELTGGGGQLHPGNRNSHTENYTSQTILDYESSFGAGGQGGNGGAATTLVGTLLPVNAGTLKISGKDQQNMKFLSEYNASVSARPMSQNNTPLYRAVITAVDANNNETPVEGAVASITKDDVTYNNVSDNNGAITLWLPLDSYTLKHANVIHDSIGWMREPAELQVTDKDNATATAKLGVNLVFTVNKKVKAYTNGTDTPVTLKMDATMVQEANVTQPVRWFREPFQKDDAANDTTYRPTTFDVGYDEANKDDKGELTKANEKLFELPISENGRYWAEITMNMGGDDFKVVRLVEVKNIYREFAIETRTREMTRDNKEKYTSDYEALKNANGTLFVGQYGFPWDLNGYNAADISAGTLLTGVDYDTVSICALSSKVKWYNAAIGNNGLNKNANKTAFEPVSLTLDAAYLANNKYVDSNTNGARYTITYTPEGVPVAEVTIRGVVQNDDGSEKTQLWSITNSFPENVTEADIEGWPQAGYRIDKVLVDGNNKTDELKDGVIHLTNMSGTEANNYADAVQKVEFVYVNNMTDVTVKSVLNDAKKNTEDATKVSATYTVPVEIGTEKTFVPPVVDGYTCVGSSKGDTYKINSVAANDSITFYYEKAQGNVTYQAVCEEKDGTKTVLWTDKGTVTKGKAPADKTPNKGVDNYDVDDNVATKYTITGTDTEYPNGGAYNGVNDITVTYTYKHKTRKVQVQWMNILNSKVVQTDTPVDKNVGEYASISSTVPDGYTVVGSSTATILVDNTDTTQLTATLYCKPSDEATIIIQMFSKKEAEKQDGIPFNTVTLTASYDAEQTVTAPTLLGWKLKTGEDGQKKITPTKGQPNTVKFVYEMDMETITVNLKVKDGAATTDLPADSKPAGWTGKFEVQKGQNFSVMAPDVKGYKLADTGLDGQAQAPAWNATAEDLKTTKEYTFYYSKISAEDLVKITVKGVGPEGDAKPLYTYEKLVPVGAADQKVGAFAQAKLALKSATVGGQDATISDAKEVTVSLNGKNAGDEIAVVFTYKSNMATVIINAKLNNNKTTPVPGFTPITLNAEIGEVLTYTAPAIENYVYVSRTHDAGLKVTGDPAQDVIDFYYDPAPVKGNVTYVAVDKDNTDTILAYGKSAQLSKGETVDTNTDAGITKFFPAGVTNWEWTKEAPSVNGAQDGKYDGQNNITVTFKFQRGTKAINIKLMDADTGEKITVAGKTHTQIVPKGVETVINAPTVDNYTVVTGQTVKITAADNNTPETVTFFYRKNDNSASVTVELWYKDPANGGAEKLFNSYTVPGVLGTTRTVTAPDLSGQGFTNPDKASEPVTFGVATPKVKFVYQNVEHKTVTVKLASGADDLTTQVNDLKTSYVLLKGEKLTFTAPSIYGYALAEGQAAVIDKAYDALKDNEVITINYKKVDVDFVKINVIGKVEGAANNLYSYVTSAAADAGSAELNVYDWPEYKIKDGQVAVTGDKDETLTVRDGKVTVNFDKTARNLTVNVTYVKNTAQVTVKAHLFVDGKNTTEPVDGFNEITFEGVIGEDVTYTAPSLPGYALKGSSMADNGNKHTVSANADQNVIIFYYAKNKGLVTYKAVDDDGKDLGYSVSKDLPADTVVDSSDANAPVVPNYRVTPGSAKVTGATTGNKFDGKNPVTVTYTYAKFTKKVKIILMNDATHREIGHVDSAPYEAGTSPAIPAPEKATVPALNGYKLVSAPTQTRFIMDNDNEQSVTFYYSMEDANRPQITVNLKDEKGNLIHSYQVTGDWDMPTNIAIPDLTAQGYEYSEAGITFKSVTPKRDEADTQKLDLTYNTLTWNINVTITPTEASDLLPERDYARTYTVKRNSAFTLTAPSIPGYTLTSNNLNQTWDKVDRNQNVTFTYQLDGDVTNSVHTIVGQTNDGRELYKFTQTVIKDGQESTYNATPIDGYAVDKQSDKLSNATSGTVTFTYTNNAATVTVVPVDETGTPIAGASVTYTGYTKGQQGVKVRAIHVDGKVLVGDLIKTINLSAREVDNEVKFTYKDKTANVVFILNCADDHVVIRAIEATAGDYSVAAGGKLDLTEEGFDFAAANEGNDEPFKNNADGSVTIGADSENKTYNLYYTHHKQRIEYAYELTDGTLINLGSATNSNPDEWSVNENLVVAAPQIPGYTAVEMRKSVTIKKQANGAAQKITFQYTKKATGTITVEHKVAGEQAPFSSYTVTVSDGEWFTANALTDAKYTLKDQSKATQTVQASGAEPKTVTFEYDKNFVTVNTYTNIGTGDQAYETGIEVVKGKNAELTPPVRGGYVLKGIKVVKGADTIGGENDLTVRGYANDKLTLTALAENAKVYYYYKPISEAVTENQVAITVIEKYEAYQLGSKTYKETKLTADTRKLYPCGTYEGFKVIGYEIDGAAQTLPENFTGASVDHKTNHTITYIYGLTDGSNNVVVPGKDNKLPSADDVTVKPTNPNNKPKVDGEGTVTVPEGGATVETPNGKVDVPKDSTVDKNGNIKGPDGKPIDPANPGEVKDHYFIQYKANGGEGESYTKYFKTDAKENLKTVGELFTKSGFTATGWNTYANGKGETYNENAEVSGKSLTLYAQWKQNEQPSGRYEATIVLKPNGAEGADVKQTIASNENNPIRENIKANPFTLDGWTFKGWLTETGAYYADQAVAEVAHGKTLNLLAQWIKENADGSITVPGQDNTPKTPDDVTAKPNPNPAPGEDGSLKRDDATGEITVPNGGSAVKKDNEIDMPNGGTVKPDGEIIIKQPDNSKITIDKNTDKATSSDGKTVFCVTYKPGYTGPKNVKVYSTSSVTVSKTVFTREGYVFGYWTGETGTVMDVGTKLMTDTTLTAQWYAQGEDGSITVPGTDNKDVTVKPDADGKKPEVKDDGTVTIPGTGPVETPDGPVIVPEGSVVKPDGSVVNPDGTVKLYPTTDGATPAGYIKVTYNSGIDSVKPVVQLVKGAEVTILQNSPFGEVKDKTFLYWNDANGKEFKDTTVTADTVLTAQWKNTGSVILSVEDGSKVKQVELNHKNENVLTMYGSYTNRTEDKTYTIPVLVDGKTAQDNELRWYVEADSYKREFGFTGDLDSDDIVTVNAQTGEIRVKNSGIVRIYCESVTDSSIKLSFVLVVPGDINRDGMVDMDDSDLVSEFALNDDMTPDDFQKLLGKVDWNNPDADIDVDDADYIDEIVLGDKKI